MKSEAKVKTLYKSLKILECFTESSPELGVTEISKKLGLYKSNVFNILSTFESEGYLERNNENNKYKLGIKILELSYIINANMGFRETVLPYLQDLSNESKEVVYFGIPSGEEVVYLDMILPRNTTPPKRVLGEKAPLYSTAIGKAIMAYYSEEKQNEIISHGLNKITENTITDEATLKKELELTIERGYSIDNMENEHGVKCIGKALFNKKGQVIAGISISGPSLRFTKKTIGYFNSLIQKYAKLISERL